MQGSSPCKAVIDTTRSHDLQNVIASRHVESQITAVTMLGAKVEALITFVLPLHVEQLTINILHVIAAMNSDCSKHIHSIVQWRIITKNTLFVVGVAQHKSLMPDSRPTACLGGWHLAGPKARLPNVVPHSH